MKIEACHKIGYVVKTHGLKGELTLALGPECPELSLLQTVFIEVKSQLVPYSIQSSSVKGVKAYVKFEDLNTVESAGLLTGASVYIPKNSRPTLPRGEFYKDEVVGFEVADVTQGPLGFVKEVLETGANRHLIVNYLGREIMIPLNGPFITNVSKAKKKLMVDLPEGFLEI